MIVIICNVYSWMNRLPYTQKFSRYVYFMVKHGTRVFVVEVYLKVFELFVPCYMAMYKEFMLLI